MLHSSIPTVSIVSFALMALHAPPALCCICGDERAPPEFPLDGAENVPVDALLWTNTINSLRLDHAWVVETSSMEEVEGEWAQVRYDFHSVLTFAPKGGWKPNTSYSARQYSAPPTAIMEVEGADALDDYEVARVSFTTKDQAWDSETTISEPTYEITQLEPAGRPGSCDTSNHRIRVEFKVPHSGLLLVAEIEDDDVATQSDALRYFIGTTEQTLEVGTLSCAGPWLGVQPGDTGTFRFGAYDVTGKLHWFPRAVTVELPELEDPLPPEVDGDSSGQDTPVPEAAANPIRARSVGASPLASPC